MNCAGTFSELKLELYELTRETLTSMYYVNIVLLQLSYPPLVFLEIEGQIYFETRGSVYNYRGGGVGSRG